MNRCRYRIALTLTVLSALACTAPAAEVRVVKSAGETTRLDVSGFSARGAAASTFRETLIRDLQLSGWFDLRSSAPEFRLTGAAADNGERVEARCTVRDAAGQTVFAKRYQSGASAARRLAHRVSDAVVKSLTGRPGIASTRIAFVGTRSGAKELYLCDADGAGVRRITRDGAICVAPNWGPRASRLVYTSYARDFPDIHLLELASGRRRVIASYGGLNTGADLAPDGRHIALILSKDGNPDLYVKDMKSGALRRLTRTANAAEASPSWSPDGKHLVYVSDHSGRPHLYIIPARGGRPRRFTSMGTENVAPDWGEYGWIAWSSRRGGRYRIALANPSTGERREAGPADGADYEEPSWARDGRHIVCTRTSGYRSALYRLDTVTGRSIPLVTISGDWYTPAWSP
ncbi:DPP IV N-terminal domain-containing protein [Kiritimatiella glycovorans]|uniref:OmpA/MotB domain protein n=1 Tax=Kiritimatiella glycovorans TaxID=1307763 RepID=A0A0G3EF72_9BACT|nr:DPP IV N-terminal domain-containing protein [Kiritimatiella glycovorans]AKJ65106.1 OmpA/MotB domain protein [Kiritimatiella glycovorans]